ncbi:MAG TPA: PAS domain-containing protein [Opitutus sp.]|nr:PAS domain-containing protein [Opitutus sp.]
MAGRPAVTPIDASRDFRVEELFFSTTDRRGVIRSGNKVFSRVSGYPADQLIGRPHNLIRHPDMPRAVFRLIWDYLKAGKSVAGYVKNMAADGRHYWVMAVISPMPDGYLAVRFKPTSPLHAKVEALYRDILQAERAAPRGGDIDAGVECLQAGLHAAGFGGYDAFMVAALHAELKSRDETLATQRRRLVADRIESVGAPELERTKGIYDRCQDTYGSINRLYAELDEYARLQQVITDYFSGIVDAAADFRLVALNATIKSAHLGDQGRCAGVIASQLAETSQSVSDLSRQLNGRIRPVADGLRAVILHLAAARLQLEMVMFLLHEIASATTASADEIRMVDELQLGFDRTLESVSVSVTAARGGLRGFGSEAAEMHRLNLAMQVTQIGGAVEATKLQDGGSLAQTFHDVREMTEASKVKLTELTQAIESFAALVGSAPAIIRQVTAAAEVTRRDIRDFLGLLSHQSAKPSAAMPEPASPAGEPIRPSTPASGAGP